MDGMKGLESADVNTLTAMTSAVSISKMDILKALKDAAAAASKSTNTVTPEITTNIDA